MSLQTFDIKTAFVLIISSISIISVVAAGLLGGGIVGEWVQGWRQELNFQTEKERIKSLS